MEALRIAHGLDRVVEVSDEGLEVAQPVPVDGVAQVDILRRGFAISRLGGDPSQRETDLRGFIDNTMMLNRDNVKPEGSPPLSGTRWPADPEVRELHMEFVAKFQTLVEELGDVSNVIGSVSLRMQLTIDRRYLPTPPLLA